MIDNPSITLFIISGHILKDDVDRLIRSFMPVKIDLVSLSYKQDIQYDYVIKSPWWCYMYGNEWLEEKLAVALPTHLAMNEHSALVLMKKVKVEGEMKYFEDPRIFRSEQYPLPSRYIELVDKPERLLDGWVLEQNRD